MEGFKNPINKWALKFAFDMSFIVDMTSSAETMYEPIVQKCAEYLIELEMEYNFLTNPKYKTHVLEVMEKMFVDLSTRGESVIEVTLEDDEIVSLYFKLCPLYRGCEPPEIDYHMVPMFIREVELTDRLVEKMDVLSLKKSFHKSTESTQFEKSPLTWSWTLRLLPDEDKATPWDVQEVLQKNEPVEEESEGLDGGKRLLGPPNYVDAGKLAGDTKSNYSMWFHQVKEKEWTEVEEYRMRIAETQRKSQKALANPKEELRAAWRAFVRFDLNEKQPLQLHSNFFSNRRPPANIPEAALLKCLREPGVWIEKTRQGNLFQVKVNNKMRRREDKIFHNLPLDQF
ncbi:hypothetical protein B9Z55_027367 [Caenorhabditis nigoni]|uniref:Uncharacterized protein n=1 Tax=Caenorhabditis nigoni TaxID=1611254 RepID=A0A2G5SGL8_9PELO|nr:hypothetical protein B9Z55_027367 [Caenorhabditis nigoni]